MSAQFDRIRQRALGMMADQFDDLARKGLSRHEAIGAIIHRALDKRR